MTASSRRPVSVATLVELVELPLTLLGAEFIQGLLKQLPQGIKSHAQQSLLYVVGATLLIAVGLYMLRHGDPRRIRRIRRRFILLLLVIQGLLIATASVLSDLLSQALQGATALGVAGVIVLVIAVILPDLAVVIDSRVRYRKTDRQELHRRLTKNYKRRYKQYWENGLRDSRADIELLEMPALVLQHIAQSATTDVPSAASGHPNAVLLTHNQTLRNAFDAAERQVLFLGGPGSGKSIQLVLLARDVLESSGPETNVPLPVILDVSMWATEQTENLEDWLANEIRLSYRVSRQSARDLIAARQIAPFLDALDQLNDDDRARCIAMIKTYRKATPKSPLVVCSRLDEYQAMGVKLDLQRAWALQPLTLAAIDGAIERAARTEEPTHMLLEVVSGDELLREAVRTPFILNFVIQAYFRVLRDKKEPPIANLEAWEDLLLEGYLKGALDHSPGPETPRTPDRLRSRFGRTLGWAGSRMNVDGMLLPERSRGRSAPSRLSPALVPTSEPLDCADTGSDLPNPSGASTGPCIRTGRSTRLCWWRFGWLRTGTWAAERATDEEERRVTLCRSRRWVDPVA